MKIRKKLQSEKNCQYVKNVVLSMRQESKIVVQWIVLKKIFKKELMKQQKTKRHIQMNYLNIILEKKLFYL